MKRYAILLSLFVAFSAHAGKCGCSGKPSPAPSKPPAAAPAPAPTPAPSPSPSVASGGTWKPWNDDQYMKSRIRQEEIKEDKLVEPVQPDPVPEDKPVQRILEREQYLIVVPMPYPVESVRVEQDIKLELIQTASVFFKTNSTKLTDDGKLALATLALRAQRTANAQIAVASGHASTTGTKERNAVLADGRAKAVVAYLVEIGFPKDQIKQTSHGDDNPEFTAKKKADHLLNQRVDIVLRGTR